MKQVFIKKGQAYVNNVPAPTVSSGNVIVQVEYSCISIGTEMTGVKASSQTVIEKALKNPSKIKKGLALIREQGFIQGLEIIKDRTESPGVTGYSAAGVIVEVGELITDLRIGDKVACAGAGYANHAEYIEVPRNLVIKVPEGVGLKEASTVALGAIAMQGIRRADIRFGEWVAVIGMGCLGQITAQIINAAGGKAIVSDLSDERLTVARQNGAYESINSANENIIDKITKITDGYGVDAAIITAASQSCIPLQQAFQICRKKGKVVLVGVVGMQINREDMYAKELDFLISTSYGPGRYDPLYEEGGIDYPYHYVRWTEGRNMQEYLAMIGLGKINLANLIEQIYDIDEVGKAYQDLSDENKKPIMALLKYPPESKVNSPKRICIQETNNINRERINTAIVGAGEFAKGMHLPNLRRLETSFCIQAIMSKKGSNAQIIAEKYGASYATTDFNEIIRDDSIDLVMICTRHNLHAQMSLAALNSGKAVFVEKPMALNIQEMNQLLQAAENTSMPFMVGFNRRFSKYAGEIKRQISNRINPMVINYRMNAGYIPLDHWVHGSEGGGRIIGEACHIFDLFNFFTDSKVENIFVNSLSPKTGDISKNDNVTISIKYGDGSVCNLIYTSLGNPHYPKEHCEIFWDGKVIIMEDYRKITGYGVKLTSPESKAPEKGQYEELLVLAKAIKENTNPIPLWQLRQATEVSFIVDNELKNC